MKRSVRLLKKRYPVRVMDYSVDLDKPEYFQLQLQVKGPLSRVEIRALLEGITEDFLEVVNSDLNLCTYMSNYCVPGDQVGVTLMLVDSSKADLYSPDSGMAFLDKGDFKLTTRYLKYDEESQEYITTLMSEVGEGIFL